MVHLAQQSRDFPHDGYQSLTASGFGAYICQIGGGGHVEDALADLTGGVAGRFYTADAGRAERVGGRAGGRVGGWVGELVGWLVG